MSNCPEQNLGFSHPVGDEHLPVVGQCPLTPWEMRRLWKLVLKICGTWEEIDDDLATFLRNYEQNLRS